MAVPLAQLPADWAGWANVKPLRVESHDGRPFVSIPQGHVYALKLHNETKHDAAVTTSIDGLDSFVFSEVKNAEGRAKYSHSIIGPGQAILSGWHKTNENVFSFLVTEYGHGAASQFAGASRGATGVITLGFAFAWEGNNVPPDEAGSRNANGNETGIGPVSKSKGVEVQRHIGVVRDVISIRYSR